MSALVRRIRRLILSGGSNQELQEAIEELGLTAGEPVRGSLQKLQRIILNDGRDSEVQLRRAINGIGVTGGDAGGRERTRIRDAILRTGRVAEIREAIDMLITLEGGAPEWLEGFRAPSGDLPAAAFDFLGENYWDGEAETTQGSLITLNAGSITASGLDIPGTGTRPVLAGAALTKAVSRDFTVVIRYRPNDASRVFLLVLTADDSDLLDARHAPDGLFVSEWYDDQGSSRELELSPVSYEVGTLSAAAVTITAAKIAASSDGGSFVETVQTVASNPMTEALLGGEDVDLSFRAIIIESIAFYDAQPNADLPTLSALS